MTAKATDYLGDFTVVDHRRLTSEVRGDQQDVLLGSDA